MTSRRSSTMAPPHVRVGSRGPSPPQSCDPGPMTALLPCSGALGGAMVQWPLGRFHPDRTAARLVAGVQGSGYAVHPAGDVDAGHRRARLNPAAPHCAPTSRTFAHGERRQHRFLFTVRVWTACAPWHACTRVQPGLTNCAQMVMGCRSCGFQEDVAANLKRVFVRFWGRLAPRRASWLHVRTCPVRRTAHDCRADGPVHRI